MTFHPFFDAITYPWALPEATALHEGLYRAVQTQGEIDHYYKTSGGLGTPFTAQAADLAWGAVLTALCVERRLQAFCDMAFANQKLASVKAAITAVREAESTVKKIVQTRGPTFFDRRNLRAELERLAAQEIDGVLLVRGASGSGKSWSQKLVRNFAEDLGGNSIYLFSGQVFTIDDVLQQLFTTLQVADPVPPQLSTEPAWFGTICLKLQLAAQKSNKQLWVVVDDLGADASGPLLDAKILDFFKHFGMNMANPAFAQWFRLILLDYPDEPPPTRWNIAFGEDRPDPNEVDAPMMAQYLLGWANHRDKQLGADRAEELALEIVAKAQAAPSPAQAGLSRLARLRAELEGVLRTL